MTDGAERRVSPRPDLDRLLLDTKFAVPAPRPGTVSRAHLVDLARSSVRRVVGVTAAAGYGKTTFLAEWARADDRRVAWVSLDRFDDDAATLLELLASAYGRLDPHGGELVSAVTAPGVSLLGRSAPKLASAFSACPARFVLFLDDLQELRAPECHDVLGILLSKLPAGSQLVAASRSEQPHLARLRAAGDALELGAGELALDASAAQQIFSDAQVDLSADSADALIQRTEGWPVGVYLASLIASENGDGTVTVTGDDRYIADYMYRESLVRQPEELQRFLRCTSVLDQLSGSLCDAVLESSQAADHLRTLETSSLFVVPLDRRREWYRYHALFREFLLGELRRREPQVIERLHLRASNWYEEHGSPALALEHLLHTADRQRAARLVAQLAISTYNAGRISTVERWLSSVGEAAIEDFPPLTVIAGWISALTGDAHGARRWATLAENASFDLVPGDGSASFESARAMLRAVMCSNGPAAMLSDASDAVAQELAPSPWRDTALWELAEAHLLDSNIDEARIRFAESSAYASANDNADSIIICESELALLDMDSGDWASAAAHVELALATIETRRMDDYVLSLLAFVAAARMAVHHGDLKGAEAQLARAMRARPAATDAIPFVSVRLRLELSKVYFNLGDSATARHLLREIDEILRPRAALGRLNEQVEQVRLTATTTRTTSPGWSAAPALTPAELRLLPYLQTHLTFSQIAERLFVSRNTVATHVHAIYRKFGVSSRDNAVQRATATGLLGG